MQNKGTGVTAIDQRTFRKALGCFATGVTIVTSTDAEGRPVGLTVSAFTSLSLEPPLVLVCLDKKTSCLNAFRAAGHFAVHVLRDSQRDLSGRFAIRGGDKWQGIAFERRTTGAPILPGCLAVADCRIQEVLEGGDHLIFIGRVEGLEFSEAGGPLLYFRGAYGEMGCSNIP